MTWKITVRAAPGALIAAEYECPVHGRFCIDVPRDVDGDPPDFAACPAWRPRPDPPLDSIIADLVLPMCGELSAFVISAPGIARVRKVEAHRGGYQKPEFSTWTDTENLGEGQDIDDWKDDRAKVWEREREREAMELAREL